MRNIPTLRQTLEQRKGMKSQIQRAIKETEVALRNHKRLLNRHERAREIIREVGLRTQQQLQVHISNITSLALEAVFEEEAYELIVQFVQRRNKTECDIFFERNNNRVDPLAASGVGAVDVAAFGLRTASWSMQNPKSRNVLILDEPFKHLKGPEHNRRVLEMIKQISQKLNLQIIMVSDERIPKEDIMEASDKVFEVSIHKEISTVK